MRRIVVCSSYLPYDSPELPPSEELERLVSYCRTNVLELLVGCDANSHHFVWGSSDSNDRDRALVEYFM